MKKMISYKEESRKDWGQEIDPATGQKVSMDNVQLGAMLRIADAVEKMTVDRVRLEKDLNFYKDQYRLQQGRIASLIKSRDAYKGKFNGLKRKMEGGRS